MSESEKKIVGHTPGPWMWEREGLQLSAGKPCNRTAVISVRHDVGGVYLSVSDADRPLIEAAPDLLAACRQVEGMAKTLMDEAGKGPATNWAVVNKCLCDVAAAISKAEPTPS